jgi:Ca2+/H+ antiporter, TMEM165/GDT1 family
MVTIGGLIGHAICSCAAVIGGRILAKKISVKAVTLAGALLFVLFGVFGLYRALVAFYDE